MTYSTQVLIACLIPAVACGVVAMGAAVYAYFAEAA